MRIRRGVIVSGIVCALLGALVHAVSAQARRADAREASEAGDWPTYNRDLAGTRYSRLTQINTKNVSTLAPAWSYRLRPEPGKSVPAIDKPASSFEIFQQVTPIVVNGVMYLPSGNRVVALEPGDRQRDLALRAARRTRLVPRRRVLARRPLDVARGRRPPARIFFTSLRKLIALRADTGALARDFGDGGVLDLEIPYAGVPVIYRNVVLMGSNFFGPGERHIGPHLDDEPRRERRRARLRRAHRQEGVGLSHHSRGPAKSVTTRGATTAGRIAPATTSGRSR